MSKNRVRNLAIFIGGWDLILCFTLFQVLNIWGIIYPLLCVVKELKINCNNWLKNVLNWLLNTISLLRLTIFLLSLVPVLLSPLLWIILIAAHPHTSDYRCTFDWICDDQLEIDYLWKIIYASLAIVIDFVWIRPNISQYYDRICYFPVIKNNEYK